MILKTADLCDEYPDLIRVVNHPGLRDFGGLTHFFGMIHTIKCHENNPFVKKALETDGTGKVLVVDGGASLSCALAGDMLGELAVKNGWSGLIINGCVRDSDALSKLNIGVKALGTNPLKSGKLDIGEENVVLKFADTEFIPGQYIYCDEDGIVVSFMDFSSVD